MGKSERNIEQDFISLGGRRLALSALWDQDRFDAKATASLKQAFIEAEPFPHLVLDGLFNGDLLDLVGEEFSQLDRTDWRRARSDNDSYYRSQYQHALKPAAELYFARLHSKAFVKLLSDITGVASLIPDPGLLGGGLHESKTGDWFGVHVDFARHAKTLLANELVVITYLNRDWRDEYGGALELWDADTGACVRRIAPVFGRTVILKYGKSHLHGHPDPVAAPDGRSRRSVAAYFYGAPVAGALAEPPDHELGTAFFQPRPPPPRRAGAKALIRLISPPVLLDGARLVRVRLTRAHRWDGPAEE